MKKTLLLFLCVWGISAQAQVTFNGNGNSGFGGVVGNGSLQVSESGSNVIIQFNRGSDVFNDFLVLYVDVISGGISSTSSVVDFGDAHRKAMTTNNVNFNFPSGFSADRAIVLNREFGAMWNLTAPFNNLPFVATGLSFDASRANNLASYSMTFSKTDFGLGMSDPVEFKFFGYYLNPTGGDFTNGFVSNEGFTRGLPGSNLGGTQGTSFAVQTYYTYPSNQQGGVAPTAATGNWSTVSNWTNGNLPFSTDAVVISHDIAIDDDYAASSVEVTSGNTLTVNAEERLSVTGGVTGAGSFVVNGIFRLNAGGFTTIVPTYGAGTSQLTYNTGGNYNISSEWPGASSPASIRIINSAVVLSANRNVTGLLEIESGGSLDVNGNILSLKATSETDYSQLLNNGTLLGNVTFERAITGSTAGWRFVSPAVTGTLADLGTVQLTGAANVIKLNTANPNAWVAQGGASTDALTPGRGYAIYFGGSGVNNNTVATTMSLTGSVQNADVNVTGLSDGNNGTGFGWTLVGNPYPAGLNWNDVNHVKTNISDAYYVWNPTLGGSGQYASYVGGVSNPGGALDGFIPPMQAFLVKATDASPVLNFSAQGRSSSASKAQMRVENVVDKLRIKVTNLQNQKWDEATLVSRVHGDLLYEAGFDAFKLKSFDPNAVNVSTGGAGLIELSINNTGVWQLGDGFPLHIESNQAGLMRIEIDASEMTSTLPIFLEEVMGNILHDLRSGPLDFYYHPTHPHNRFSLLFYSYSTSVKPESELNALVYAHEGVLYVKGATGRADLRITDMQGRTVFQRPQWEMEEALVLPAFAKGVYVVQLHSAQGVKIVKLNF